jgi:hypothetical protein
MKPTPAPGLDELLQRLVADAVGQHAEELARPEYVHQRSVERVVGVPSSAFLAAARAGAFASSKRQRLVYARRVDVVAWLEASARPSAANDVATPDEARALARVGARRIAP